ncbi:hypothetical protein MMC07_002640 [Pseudocyphellaria aurata]|nr:hypothetical protein [Pseudocyphellaria aurata]
MPITALPSDTVRSIGSTQVLTDSCSLVKELIDNSIDAGASAIFLEISVNSLDVVQVKDNGHGILPDDRRMVCRRHCTSKIRSFDDIKSIGGKSLGFRGEALASAAETSGGMVVSTRIEGETTAVSLTINRQGEIEKEARVSQPVGTTVRIIDFMKNLPVRRQTALKTSTKSIAKIKKLLQAYAYARPSLRFSLKVLKATNDKSNWIYAPAIGDTVLDAAVKICGSRLVDQCMWKVWKSAESSSGIVEVESNGKLERFYKIEALLPSPNCDTAIVNNTGNYVSIDSRPVSCTRGTLKQIVSLYKSYLGSGCLVEGTSAVKDPFFCMNIVCPSTSYDVNIEPAKDDILFINADSVIIIFECFMKNVYGELRTRPTDSNQSKSSVQRPRGFDVLLAKKPSVGSKTPKQSVHDAQPANGDGENAASMPSANSKPTNTSCSGVPPLMISQDGSVQNHEQAELGGRQPNVNPDTFEVAVALPKGISKFVIESSAAEQGRGWQRNMNEMDEDDANEPHKIQDDDSQSQHHHQSSDEEAGLRDESISNPWAFAKLNASACRSNIAKGSIANVESNDQLLTPGREVVELSKATTRQVHDIPRGSNISKSNLPTPARDRRNQATCTTSQPSPSPEPSPFPQKSSLNGSRKIASNKHTSYLDSWVQRQIGDHPVMIVSDDALRNDFQDLNVPVQTTSRDFVSARALPLGDPLVTVPERVFESTRNRDPKKKTTADSNKPFVSPTTDLSRVCFDIEPKEKGILSQSARAENVDALAASNGIRFEREEQGPITDPVTESCPTRSNLLVHPELAATMDYEIRKQAALQHWKSNQRRKAVAKDFVPSSEDEPSRSSAKASPHQNRYSRAVANLHISDGGAASVEPRVLSFEPGDPRAYLLRAQEQDERITHGVHNDSAERPRYRRKTGLLPLETIPEDLSTRNLSLTLGREEVGREARLRASRAGGVLSCDEYISGGISVEAFSSCTIQQIHVWEVKVMELVEKLRRRMQEDSGIADDRTETLRLDIWTSLQTHRATIDIG